MLFNLSIDSCTFKEIEIIEVSIKVRNIWRKITYVNDENQLKCPQLLITK